MTDINSEAEKSLSGLSCALSYYYPSDFKTLPIVSFYTLTENNPFATDNAPDIQRGYISVDVWTDSAAGCGALSIEVNGKLEGDGWTREFSRDMPPESGISHKTMRFVKEFYLNGGN